MPENLHCVYSRIHARTGRPVRQDTGSRWASDGQQGAEGRDLAKIYMDIYMMGLMAVRLGYGYFLLTLKNFASCALFYSAVTGSVAGGRVVWTKN